MKKLIPKDPEVKTSRREFIKRTTAAIGVGMAAPLSSFIGQGMKKHFD